MTPKELKMICRRISHVTEYADEEGTCPWSYVQRTLDGRFEAITTEIIRGIQPGESDFAQDFSLGVFQSENEAIHRLWRWRYHYEDHRQLRFDFRG